MRKNLEGVRAQAEWISGQRVFRAEETTGAKFPRSVFVYVCLGREEGSRCAN